MTRAADFFEVTRPYVMHPVGPGHEDPEYVAMRRGSLVDYEFVGDSGVQLRGYNSTRAIGTRRFGVIMETPRELKVLSFAQREPARLEYRKLVAALYDLVPAGEEPVVTGPTRARRFRRLLSRCLRRLTT